MDIIYLDSNVCVGKRGLKHRLELWKTEDVLNVMEQCAVSVALVYSGWSEDYAPRYGNERLLRELKKSDRLFGCYTIMPNTCGDFYCPDEMIQDIKSKGMVATKMFPTSHNFIPDERTMGEYFQALEKAKLPILINSAEISFTQVAQILENHPGLNVLLQGVNWAQERMVTPLLREFQNLYLEFSSLQTNYVIEFMTEKFGADRLIFGSDMPKKSLGAARALIDYAEILPEEKQKIAGGNLAQLCRITLPEKQTLKNDYIAKETSEGKPLSVFVFDSHAHFLEDGGDCGGGFAMLGGDLAHMEVLNTRLGVDKYCVAPWLGIWTDSEAGNQLTLDMTLRSPEKVCGYVLIDPNYVDDVEAEACKYHLEYKIPDIKMFYARTKVRYNDPVFDPWWEIANENSLFALMDYGSYPEYLADVEELATRYPNVSFFLDHAGRSFEAAINNTYYAKKYANIYLQLTYTTVTQGMIEYFVKEGLADKILYGTDAPMRDPRPQLGWVTYADIPVEDKKKILGENMKRIYERCFQYSRCNISK